MQSAVHQGLFGVQSSEPFTCPGACRWTGSYISIGFRAECKNVTQATLETESCGREHPDDPADPVTVCTLKTPTGLDLVYHQVLTSGATTYTMNVITLVPNSTLQDTFPELTRFAIFRSSRDSYYNMYNTNVTECSLFLTAYEYAGATATVTSSRSRRGERSISASGIPGASCRGISAWLGKFIPTKPYTRECASLRCGSTIIVSKLCRTFLPPKPS